MEAPTADVREAESRLATFREVRRRFVTGAHGPLALVNTEWITGGPANGQTAYGVPGTWYPLPAGVSGLKLKARASEGIEVDGQPVDGTVIVRGKDDPRASTVRFSDTVTGFVIANEDGEYALRVWDAASEANAEFGSIDAYAYNPDWVVEASFTPIEGGRAIGIEHLKDGGVTRERVVPAKITFTKDGTFYNLAAFQDDGGLLLVFSDATSGDTTYGVGRFLRPVPDAVTPDAQATDALVPDARSAIAQAPDARPAGHVTLDFNRAYLPPCAFSYHFNCPMPPAQNRLAVPIAAGEKNVLNRDGALLHG